MTEPTDVIRLYLDDDKEPFKTARPPLRFQFSTLHLADGPHRLRVEAHNGLAGESIKEIPFHVRNGVAITITGLEPGQEIAGQVGVIVNAYAGNTEIDFEPSRAETPAPIPTWAWLIFLAIIAWTMFFLLNPTLTQEQSASAGVSAQVGARVYLDVCAKCHQETGLGAPGLGPAPAARFRDGARNRAARADLVRRGRTDPRGRRRRQRPSARARAHARVRPPAALADGLPRGRSTTSARTGATRPR